MPRPAIVGLLAALCVVRFAQTSVRAAENNDERARPTPTLYTTATAHLDTQWLWTIQTTIDEYIPATLRDNFDRFEKFPDYTFSFEGSFRYMLAREYYPEDYARLEDYVAQGRWRVCGSSVDAGDVNVPSPESLIRHVLYGNGFFEREFGVRSTDIYLPDCFGFGYALPSVAAHCGLVGFSTQKLTWGSSVGIPFEIGLWEGVDGSTVIAALNPGEYVAKLRSDLSVDQEWLERINTFGAETGAYIGFKYFGVGDRGGAPDEESVSWLERSIAGDGPIRVINVPPDRLFSDVARRLTLKRPDGGWKVTLPRFNGEMLMTRHGTGCYTSQAAMKRWNRKNELLADSAERACVVADWLGLSPYPTRKFEEAWTRFLWHQFHDDLTGTSIPEAYTFSWNDEVIALNQFAAELTNAVGAVARAMDTRAAGIPLVVFNPLAFEREDVVEATVRFAGQAPTMARVYDPTGREVPSQVNGVSEDTVRLLFLARVSSVGFSVFEVRPASTPYSGDNELTVSPSAIENKRYRATLDANGDVASLYHKKSGRELLDAPIRLQLLRDTPDYWSEWEVRYEDVMATPFAHVTGPARVKVLERGPVRATVEVTRETADSTFIQRVSLSSGGSGDRLEFDTHVDWRTPATLLKACFPFTASHRTATYDLGLGVIERPNNTERLYEVPAQQWADITDTSGSFGVAVLNDCKYGWDKPADNTLRLTLNHSPNEIEKDMGWHEFTYAVAGHVGDWRRARVVQRAARLNQPLIAFQTTSHAGRSGRSFSFLEVDSPQVVVRALKKSESSDEVIVRLHEVHGTEARDVTLRAAGDIQEAREVTGAEKPIRSLTASGRSVDLDFAPFKPRTLALELKRPTPLADLPDFQAVELPFDTDVASFDTDRDDGDFDGSGHTFPAELLPKTLLSGGVPFTLGPTENHANQAVSCRGQQIALPDGDFDRLYLLAAADETTTVTFRIGDTAVSKNIRAFSGWIGQSQSLIANGRLVDASAMTPAFIHRDQVAWVGTHRHHAPTDRNEPYVFCYLFRYSLDVPHGATTIALPHDERIKILAMTAASRTFDDTAPAHALYDEITAIEIEPSGGLFIEPLTVRLQTDAAAADTTLVYTLDGSLPTVTSSTYTRPLEVGSSKTITVRAVKGGVLEDHFIRSTFRITEPTEAVKVGSLSAGVRYDYYEGKWARLPDFHAITPVKSGKASAFTLSSRGRDHEYGFAFSGFLKVPIDGVYTFYTASDDGSKLSIDDVEVVNNDGLHGKRERFGETALRAGLHPIKVTFFERGGDDELEVSYEGPGIERTVIPSDVLFHAE
ncbi:MAG: glycoside hydrolase family 38 C-terminal domain-containing protein [Phycisphaerae bacterium]|jgi:alpha-mannosidase